MKFRHMDQDVWSRFQEQVLVPNSGLVTQIWNTGGIVCAVFELMDQEGGAAARGLGWDGAAPVFRLTARKALRVAGNLSRLSPGDPASRWFSTERFGRLFLFVHGGTLCLNFDRNEGYSIAEGTLDREWKS